MNGIVVNIDPMLLRIGDHGIHWYSVAIILAVLAATLVAAREVKRKGIDSAEIWAALPWVLVAGLVGARLFHVVDRWDYYAANPIQMLALQQGGLAIWGGLAGGGAALLVYARTRHIPLGRLVDALVPALLTAQIIGRFGCIINGDTAGAVTSLPWGFIYTNPNSLISGNLYGLPTHPYPVYEMLWNGLTLLVLLNLRKRIATDGLTFLTYLSIYSVGRFILTFVRLENTYLWGLQEAQVVALGTLAASIAGALYLVIRGKWNVTSESAV